TRAGESCGARASERRAAAACAGPRGWWGARSTATRGMMPQAPPAGTPAAIALHEPSCHSRTPGGAAAMDESVTSMVKRDSYQDSVRLMELTMRLQQVPGVETASAMMGTAANKALFADAGLLTAEITAAGPGDLCIAIRASDAGLPPDITEG